MLDYVKHSVISQLWQDYSTNLLHLSIIQASLQTQYQEELRLDHLALIDLPGPESGMEVLSRLFSYLGYVTRGQGYLAAKQNNFRWLAEQSTTPQLAISALPQIVVADFRREALAPEVLKIIDHYAAFSKPLDNDRLTFLQEGILQHDETAANEMIALMMNYLKGRDWPLPTVNEYEMVKSHNELLAWVLVRGRQVNHFAWAIHLSKCFSSLEAFNSFLSSSLKIPLNEKGGLIKGRASQGIKQSSTLAAVKWLKLADGMIDLPDRFIEFVWRYPKQEGESMLWEDYFTGFIADNADRVVESLFLTPTREIK